MSRCLNKDRNFLCPLIIVTSQCLLETPTAPGASATSKIVMTYRGGTTFRYVWQSVVSFINFVSEVLGCLCGGDYNIQIRIFFGESIAIILH
jgi:hypothetical protein